MGNKTENAAGRRIAAMLDAGSFVEIGGAVTARNTDFNMQEKETPADGVITGYGVIDGNLVYVYSQDVSVLNGAIGEMHAKKIARIYDMAMKMGAPVIGLIDCAGLRLQEATDALEEKGRLFVNSPNAIAGNRIEKCDTASAAFQSKEVGLVDGVETEDEILEDIRTLICMLPCNNEEDASYDECNDDLNRVCEGIEDAFEDAAIALSQISDDQIFFETKKDFAQDMVTGFIRLNGMTVGAVANRSVVYNEEGEIAAQFDGSLSADGANKAAEFVEFCDAFNIPVLSLTNVSGFAASEYDEKHLAKAAAKLTYAFANATVPKVNVVTGKAFGSAYVAMNSKSTGADMVYAWETSEIGMMDAALAAKIMYADADADVIKVKATEYKELQSSPYAAARRGYVDTIIAPADTRKYVIGAFEMLFTKREDRPMKKHGTV